MQDEEMPDAVVGLENLPDLGASGCAHPSQKKRTSVLEASLVTCWLDLFGMTGLNRGSQLLREWDRPTRTLSLYVLWKHCPKWLSSSPWTHSAHEENVAERLCADTAAAIDQGVCPRVCQLPRRMYDSSRMLLLTGFFWARCS